MARRKAVPSCRKESFFSAAPTRSVRSIILVAEFSRFSECGVSVEQTMWSSPMHGELVRKQLVFGFGGDEESARG